MQPIASSPVPAAFWPHPAQITENNFVFKSLSQWAYNVAVGCTHGCGFCYVPSTTTVKHKPQLKPLGVDDPDLEWGRYLFLRDWDEATFLRSLAKAERTPASLLKKDGNRAVIFCSTTDAYQTIYHPDPARRKVLAESLQHLVRRALELILENSSLNVRILTRSPLAARDFDLFAKFGPRLLFGLSIPTLQNRLARVYEPNAPAVSSRLKTLQAAKAAGLNVFAAMAPTYPECDESDLSATLDALGKLEPVTIFSEPINIRSENVARIAAHAAAAGVVLNTEVFTTRERWTRYAREALLTVERLAQAKGLTERLHLWPDKVLNSKSTLRTMEEPEKFSAWLETQWSKVSAWPKD